MIKRIHSNLIFVKDLKETAVFYDKLGFEVQQSNETVRIKIGDFTLAFMDEDSATIKDESGILPKGIGIYTYIEVDDVDKYYDMIIQNGIKPRTEPKDWPWGKREFVVKDPDGYKFVFYSPINKD